MVRVSEMDKSPVGLLKRESTLLYDEKKSSLEDEFYVLLVICHEISHSWFGNKATLKWWDNLWMNEAFANTLMYFAMDHIRPEFRVVRFWQMVSFGLGPG